MDRHLDWGDVFGRENQITILGLCQKFIRHLREEIQPLRKFLFKLEC